MMLYWAIFTMGFLFGAILSFVVFAAKKPEQDPEYETFEVPPLAEEFYGASQNFTQNTKVALAPPLSMQSASQNLNATSV